MKTLAKMTIMLTDEGKYCAVVSTPDNEIKEIVETPELSKSIKFGGNHLFNACEQAQHHWHYCLECEETYECSLPENCLDDYETLCPSCANDIQTKAKTWVMLHLN